MTILAGLTFSAAYESFGAMVAAELKPGGESIAVKYEDREEYVRLYTEWILHDSVKDQIHAFKRGFDKSAQLTVKERHEMLAAKL